MNIAEKSVRRIKLNIYGNSLQETDLLLEPRRNRLHLVQSAERRLRPVQLRTSLRNDDHGFPPETDLSRL